MVKVREDSSKIHKLKKFKPRPLCWQLWSVCRCRPNCNFWALEHWNYETDWLCLISYCWKSLWILRLRNWPSVKVQIHVKSPHEKANLPPFCNPTFDLTLVLYCKSTQRSDHSKGVETLAFSVRWPCAHNLPVDWDFFKFVWLFCLIVEELRQNQESSSRIVAGQVRQHFFGIFQWPMPNWSVWKMPSNDHPPWTATWPSKCSFVKCLAMESQPN